MQNKNLRKALLVSLGVLGPLASGFANAAEISSVNDKVADKAISSETTKQLKSSGEKDKKSDSLKAATDIKEKKGSGNLAKLLIGLVSATLGTLGGIVCKTIYDENQAEKVLLNWDTIILMMKVMRTYGTDKVENDAIVDPKNDQSYLLADYELLRRKIYKDPAVLNLYSELYKLYIELLENKKIRELQFTQTYGRDNETMLKSKVLMSLGRILGTTCEKDGKWEVLVEYNGHKFLYCGMPDGDYEMTETIKDDSAPQKMVTYTAKFKKKNGVLSFVKVDFANNV